MNIFESSRRPGIRGWRLLLRSRDGHPAELIVNPSEIAALRRRSDTGAASSRQAEARVRQRVMNDDVFRSVLVRERKRADRSNHSLIVLLVTLNERLVESSGWTEAIDALTTIKRETDVLGWFEAGTTIGLVVPDIPSNVSGVARELELRIRSEIERRLGESVGQAVSLQLHVHTSQESVEDEMLWPVEPLLEKVAPRTPRVRLHASFKRAFDIAGSAALLLMLSPVFAAVAALVKLKSPGPVFFRQKRVGEGGELFEMLKFRSMHVNNDSAIHQQYVTWFITASDQEKAAKGQTFKLTNDPRITPIGAILRKTSLDELPQIWNVLRGDMSLVGPRPPLEYEVQKYAPWHRRRVLEAKPGITGLWQVTGRSRTTFDEMVRLDLRYARKVSVWTDIKILLATPRAVFMGKGAC
jgi:lipopolysaccharide/colanic/teichoic acid biosynthesis glycosyltransferase